MSKEEFKAAWYDERYKVGGHKKEYFNTPEKSIYYPLRKEILKLLNSEDVILEVGCGSGQLAAMILQAGFHYAMGFDFSKEAIKLCKRFTKESDHGKFKIGSAYNSAMYKVNHNTVVCCEVFEHLEGDLQVLREIKSGVKVVFTVPNFNSKSHVRFFENQITLMERYSEEVIITSIKEFQLNEKNKIYLVDSVKK